MEERNNFGLKTGRIEALSDGIFAIAMTILILSFETVSNQPGQIREEDLLEMLLGMWPDLLHYMESFIVLGVFWYQHHRQFHYIRRVDRGLLVLNIGALMFIGLIPFSTVMVSDFGDSFVVAALFEINLLIAGIVYFLHWLYASRENRLIDPSVDPCVIRFYSKRNFIIPAVSLCAIALSYFSPRVGLITYFAVPAILFFWERPNMADL